MYYTSVLQNQTCETEKSRIPGIVCTKTGKLLAYCEERHGEGGDWAKIDIVLKKNTDNGETWSDRYVLVENDGHTINNPVMIVGKDNTIHFIWHREYAEAYYQKSIDEGESWSEPVDITYVFEKFRPQYNWEVIASGPGHGICCSDGKLVVPVWLSVSKKHTPSVSASIYSDDDGATWKIGKIFPEGDVISPNETTVAELSNKNILFNYRNMTPNHKRAVAVTDDIENNLEYLGFDEELLDAWCFGSLVSANYKGKHLVFFANCRYETTDRYNLTIRYSNDDCKTWNNGIVIASWGGYPDICVNENTGELFCYYEHVDDGIMSLKVMRIPVEDIISAE